MKMRKMSTVFLALVAIFIFATQSAWAFTEVSAVRASNAVSAGNGVIIDVRSVDEHNGCNAAWQGFACPTAEAANRGTAAWVDSATGVTMQAANATWWVDAIGNFTSPQNTTEFRNSFQAMLDSGYISKSSPVYLICRSGGRSRAAAGWIEANMGFTNVYNIDGDGTGSVDGGMIEWIREGLLVPWISSINRGWKAPKTFSISPVDGYTETTTNTVTFDFGILEPTWGTLLYGDIVRLSLYVDGVEVASSTTDPTGGGLWTLSSLTADLTNGTHIWDIRAEALVLTSGGANVIGFNRLADDLGPGGRTITVNAGPVCTDVDGDGFSPDGGDCGSVDCNDNDALEFPGQSWYTDADGDGYATDNTVAVVQCARPTGLKAPSELTAISGDCDDNNASVNPGVTEGPIGDATCSDSVDNDCDGAIDLADPSCVVTCTDSDGDGYSVEGGACGEVDCNDNNAGVNPGATETCDGVDNNCDGSIDEGFDTDGDGYTTCGGDCDDSNSAVNLGATEGPAGDPTCSDGLDNDCDSAIDGADSGCVEVTEPAPTRRRRGGRRMGR